MNVKYIGIILFAMATALFIIEAPVSPDAVQTVLGEAAVCAAAVAAFYAAMSWYVKHQHTGEDSAANARGVVKDIEKELEEVALSRELLHHQKQSNMRAWLKAVHDEAKIYRETQRKPWIRESDLLNQEFETLQLRTQQLNAQEAQLYQMRTVLNDCEEIQVIEAFA